MKKLALLFLTFLLFNLVIAQKLPPKIQLPDFADTITWSEVKKEKIVNYVQKKLTKSLIVYQNGKKVFQYGNTENPYPIFSARKSMLSLLYGIYIKKGVINPNLTLEELGIDDKQALTKEEKKAKIIDLLRSRSGVYHQAAYETPSMKKMRPKRGTFSRDEHWYYNNWDFNALTTIFEKLTNKTVFEAYAEDIADKIGMKHFDISIQKYHKEDVSNHAATIFSLSAEDLLLLGQLLLNEGKWEDKEIIPADWLSESTRPYSDAGIRGGFGYSWWSALNGYHHPFVRMPYGTFSAQGTGMQTLTVIPEWKMVLVHQTEVLTPKDSRMRVSDFGKLLLLIFEQKLY